MVMLTIPLFGVAAGVAAHLLFFIRGEWHLRAPALLVTHLAAPVILYYYQFRTQPQNAAQNAILDILLFVSYLLGLFSSITIYRLFFHRLCRFPGPRLAAVSKLYHAYLCRNLDNHLVLERLYREYGPFVRTGPGEITIMHPGGIEAVDGSGNCNVKGEFYDLLAPRTSAIWARTQADHVERRKVWDRALNKTVLREYIPRIMRHVSTLENLIASYDGKALLLNEVIAWFSYDFMGDFAFNRSFGMMESKTWHKALEDQKEGLGMLGIFGQVVWTIRLALTFIPFYSRVAAFRSMLDHCDESTRMRMQQTTKVEPDLATHFIEEYKNGREDLAFRWNLISGHMGAAVVTGSDSTGPALVILWYHLAKYPHYAKQAYEEVKGVHITDPDQLVNLKHLNAIINEALRLFPVALTLGLRKTTSVGLTVGDTFIPGETTVLAPKYVIHRLESAFERPTEFLPERFYTPGMIKDARAFSPFGVGKRGCVGKGLALAKLRLVTALLLRKYRIRFADGETGERLISEMKDDLTLTPGPCEVVFEPRGEV